DWNLRPCLELSDYNDYYENNEITNLCMQLGALKKEYPELSEGKYKELYLRNRQFAYGRIKDNDAIIAALNNDDEAAAFDVPLPVAATDVKMLIKPLSDDARYTDIKAEVEGNMLHVELPANMGTVVKLL
ncbi:MAG: alpha-glucosidase C-terminal domain-containing protein, partial [Lachnospiraceae bacterium]|nr:alpha-glucosidase C-terminal domain-containing protein [Lachnospiraceae bacterium]